MLLGLAVQSVGDTIQHPRLFFTANDLPRIREFGFTAEEMLSETEVTIKYFGGKEVTFPLPPRQPGKIEEPPGFDYEKFGHYPYWTMMARTFQRRMQPLALAYASTGKKEYARRAVDYALSLAKWREWTDLDYGKKTCLDTCHITFGVATVYDICYDFMTPEERTTVREAMVDLGLEPMFRDMEPTSEHNMQMLRASALGAGALVLLGENDKAQTYLDSAKAYFKWFLDSRATSQTIESMGYLSYGLDNCVVFADQLHRATGDSSLVAHPYLDQVIRMAIYFQDPKASGQASFGDCGIANYFGNIAKTLNNSLDHGPSGWYLRKSKLSFDAGWSGAIYGKPIGKEEPPDAWPTSAVFRPIDWVALRSGWREEDTLFAFVSGNSKMGHNHRDQNSFILNHAGEWLLTDPGYKSYEGGAKSFFSTNTVGHNSLLVDGEGQDKLGGGKVTEFFTSGVFDYTVGDASGSYDPAKLSKFVRRVAYVKPDYFLILDEVASEGTPRNFEILLHGNSTAKYLFPEMHLKNVDPQPTDEVTIAGKKASVNARVLLPQRHRMKLTEYEGAESYGPYISISPEEKTAQTQFLTALFPLSPGEKAEHRLSPRTGDGALAVEVSGDSAADLVGFRTGGGKVSAGWATFIGESCFLRRKETLNIVQFALTDGLLLEFIGGKQPSSPRATLFMSTVPASIGLAYGEETTADISLAETGDVRIRVPRKPVKVTVDGKRAAARYEEDGQFIVLSLRPGDHKVAVR